MFNNNNTSFGAARTNNIFGANNNNTFNNNPTQNMFANKNTTNNMFGQTNQPNNMFNNTQPNNIFNNNQNNTGGNTMFNNQPNQNNNTANNIFAQNNQQGNNLFNNNQGQQGNTMFNNNNQGNNMFNNNQGQQGNNLFNNTNNQQGNNMFGNNNNQGNLFNNTTQGNNLFNKNQPNNGGIFNQNLGNQNNLNQPLVGSNPQVPFNYLPQQPNHFNLINFSPDHQQTIVKGLTNDQIRKYIDYCLKSLIDPKTLQLLALSNDNSLRGQKVNKLAQSIGMTREIIGLKKEVRDKIVTPINELKSNDKSLRTASSELAFKVTQKLQKYKQRLIQTISERKMVDDIKKQIDEIDNQIKDFLKPLYNSHQTRSNFSFIDPDQFCIKISEQILKNISHLDNKMDQLLACEGEVTQEATDTGKVIELLVDYYQNVVISLRQFSEKYQRQKKEILAKRMGNTEETLRKIMEKANISVSKELRAYELVKQIETILSRREKRNSTNMMIE